MRLATLLMTFMVAVGQAAPPPGEAKKARSKESMRSFSSVLAEGDAKDPALGQPVKVIPLRMAKGAAYRLDLVAAGFAPYLRVDDSEGRDLTTLGKVPAAQFDFIAEKDDEYQLVVSTADGKTGGYKLSVLPLGRPGDPGVAMFEGEIKGAAVKHPLKVQAGRHYVVDLVVLGKTGFATLSAEAKSILAQSKNHGSNPRRAHLEFKGDTAGSVDLVVAADAPAPYFLRVQEQRLYSEVLQLEKGVLEIEEAFTERDAMDTQRKSSPCKVFRVQLRAGQTYALDLRAAEGARFDPFLRLEDAMGKELARDDDSGEGTNARITFTPKEDGVYRVIATTYSGGSGPFAFSVAERAKD